MSDNIYGNNVYSLKQRMWHSKGTIGEVGEGAFSINGRMAPVSFEIRPYHIILNEEMKVSKDSAIVRMAGHEVVVGMTKGRYQLTQPVVYCQIFDTAVGKDVETLGYLGTNGDRMFITWELPSIDVHGDKVQTYGFLAVGFDGKFGEHLYLTNVRVVCNNTWNMAINDGKTASVYSGKHNMLTHESRLASWMKYVNDDAEQKVMIYQNLFRKMEETKVGTDLAATLFKDIYPHKDEISDYYPSELREQDSKTIDVFNLKQDEARSLAMNLFQGAGIQIGQTAWGVYNSITEYENHVRPSKKDRVNSILLGNRQGTMQNAMAVVTKLVGNK